MRFAPSRAMAKAWSKSVEGAGSSVTKRRPVQSARPFGGRLAASSAAANTASGKESCTAYWARMSASPRESAPWRSVSVFTGCPCPPRCLMGKAALSAAQIQPIESNMPITISSAFDAGNIRVIRQDDSSADLEIVQDHMSDFYQWFYFRVAGAAGREVTLRITNCGGSAYPHGWTDYKGVMSLDREEWVRISETNYADGVLTMKLTPPQDVVWIAYFAPYSMERHHDLVTQTASLEDVHYRSLGKSLDGQDIDCLTIGEGGLNVWLYARQHPGESMAEWWMEGALEKLTDEDDPIARV